MLLSFVGTGRSRRDSTIMAPTKLKSIGVTGVFVKMNTRFPIEAEMVGVGIPQCRSLVVVKEDGKITGLPLPKAKLKKLHVGFRHFVIKYDPDQDREWNNNHLSDGREYDEAGFWIGWYKAKGGHRHQDEKGGELVAEFQDELSVLQYLYENGLEALYELDTLTEWGFLPMNDDRRFEEEFAHFSGGQTPSGKFIENPKIYHDFSYHKYRLAQRFRDLYRDTVVDDLDLETKVREAMAETVIGKSKRSPE
jgi:hypothetical protein